MKSMYVVAILMIAYSTVDAVPANAERHANPVESAYFAIKRELAIELRRAEVPATFRIADYITLEPCGGLELYWGWEPDGLRRRLSLLAHAVLWMKFSLEPHVPQELWRPRLISFEEELLRQVEVLQEEDAYIKIDAVQSDIAESLNDHSRADMTVFPDPQECGAGEVLVEFDHPPGARVQYIHKTYHVMCTRRELPLGLCDWVDYGGGQVWMSGQYKVRLHGSKTEPREMNAQDYADRTYRLQ